MAIFTFLLIGSLGAIVVGFGQARLSDVTLYEPPVFLVHLNRILMALTNDHACFCLFSGRLH